MIGAKTAGGAAALRSGRRFLLIVLAAWLIFPPLAHGHNDSHPQSPDLSDKSLEDLMNTEVTSVSKKEQKLSQVAAAIFVITQEDIRRSGATNIPDLLRMVPGLNVAQINASTWAVSARGFNEEFSDKLLVLLDGRAVYTPTFSGVYWDSLDVPLEDIERIEVIRGPGATIWGVNAVNGVINILTKKAGDTKGGLVSAGFGTQDQGLGTAQYGGRIGSKLDYRLFGKYLNVSDFTGTNGRPTEDAWHAVRGGMRADATLSSKDSLMVLGDLYTQEEGTIRQDVISISPPLNGVLNSITDVSGADMVAQWTEKQSEHSETSVLFYYEHYERDSTDQISGQRDTYDIEFQHHVQALPRNDFVWGVDYRNSRGDAQGNLNFSFDPASHTSQFTSFFAQDEIAIVPGRIAFYHRRALGLGGSHGIQRAAYGAAFVDAIAQPSAVASGFARTPQSFLSRDAGTAERCSLLRAGWSPGAGERIREPEAVGRAGSGLGARLPAAIFEPPVARSRRVFQPLLGRRQLGAGDALHGDNAAARPSRHSVH